MPIINMVMHPKHDDAMPTMWESWELHINGLTDVQYISLTRITNELRRLEYGTRGKRQITAVYDVNGAGVGKFPPISAIRPFLSEIRGWGFTLTHCSCPARDEISMLSKETHIDPADNVTCGRSHFPC